MPRGTPVRTTKTTRYGRSWIGPSATYTTTYSSGDRVVQYVSPGGVFAGDVLKAIGFALLLLAVLALLAVILTAFLVGLFVSFLMYLYGAIARSHRGRDAPRRWLRAWTGWTKRRLPRKSAKTNSAPTWYTHPSDQVPSPGVTSIECFTCHRITEASSDQTSYACQHCGTRLLLHLCPACSKVVFIPSRLAGQRVKCLSCGSTKRWEVWAARPVTIQQWGLAAGRAMRQDAGQLTPKRGTVAPMQCANCGATLAAGAKTCRYCSTAVAVPQVAPEGRPSRDDIPGQIRKLGELRDAGVLTDEEFAVKKSQLLARM
jgi:DNA-directed RNA polymerase subunit RPC12/RpoP